MTDVKNKRSGRRNTMSVSKIDLRGMRIQCPFVNCIQVRCVDAYMAGLKRQQAKYVCECVPWDSSPQTQLGRVE